MNYWLVEYKETLEFWTVNHYSQSDILSSKMITSWFLLVVTTSWYVTVILIGSGKNNIFIEYTCKMNHMLSHKTYSMTNTKLVANSDKIGYREVGLKFRNIAYKFGDTRMLLCVTLIQYSVRCVRDSEAENWTNQAITYTYM